jgi:hypothetical protein
MPHNVYLIIDQTLYYLQQYTTNHVEADYLRGKFWNKIYPLGETYEWFTSVRGMFIPGYRNLINIFYNFNK